MSRGARITLGMAMLVISLGFFAIVPLMAPVKQGTEMAMAVLGVFCGIVATACLWSASRPITLRIVGGFLVLVVAGSVFGLLWLQKPGNAQRKPDWWDGVEAIGLVTGIGLPAGYLAWTGRYPRWGRYGHVFRGEP